MNVELVSVVSEIIAAIGVIASLVYLSIQIKRSESTTRAATTQELLSKSTDMLMSHSSDSPYIKAQAGIALSVTEKVYLDVVYFGLFSHFNDAHHQHLSDKLDAPIWAMYDARTRKNVRQMQEFDRWWDQYKENFTVAFRAYIESIK